MWTGPPASDTCDAGAGLDAPARVNCYGHRCRPWVQWRSRLRVVSDPGPACDVDWRASRGPERQGGSDVAPDPGHPRLPCPGETGVAARNSVAAGPWQVRRLTEPSDCKVGHKGARSQMHGTRGEWGRFRGAPVRRHAMALALAAIMAYFTLGVSSLAPAFSVEVRVSFNADFWSQGEPVRANRGPGRQGGSDVAPNPGHARVPRPGEMGVAARNSVAAGPVISRTSEGNLAACGELDTQEGQHAFSCG